MARLTPHSRVVLWLATLVLCSVIMLAGCSSSSASHAHTLRLPLYVRPTTLDPAVASTASEIFVDSLLYAGLMKMAPDLHIVPDLAVSIPTISSGGRTYTFTIRQDARFADGRPCTAKDVAYSFTRALEPRSGSAAIAAAPARRYLGNISGARAVEEGLTTRLSGVSIVDGLTVRIHLRRPDSTFLQKLAFPVASIVERKAGMQLPPGAGPFILTHPARRLPNRDGTLALVPRPHYYGGSLQLKALSLVPVRDFADALDLYRKGALDVARVPLSEWARLSSHNDFHQSSSLDAYYALPPKRIGVALASSLDRDRLVQDAGPGLTPLTSIVPPAVPDYVASPPTVDPPASSNATARTVDLQLDPAADPALRLLRQALLRQWKPGTASKIELVHASFRLPDPSVWLGLVLPQTSSQWFRRVWGRATALTNDPVTRMSGYSKEEDWALSQGLIIPLASGSYGYLIKPQVQGIQLSPLGIVPDNNNWPSVSVS